MANKYSEYFKINPKYYPCVDLEAIRAGAAWANTYPHEAFIALLRNVDKMLSGGKVPVWIHGAYGTGKSQCGYALKKILEVPEVELREYWNTDAFSHVFQTNANKDLLERLAGHKKRGIVTAYRYASGGIDGVRDLLLAVQDSVKQALVDADVKDLGEYTLRDSVIAWLDDPLNKKHFDEFLELPEFASRFSQSTADEVLSDLREGGELKELLENIFYLADKRGIQAFDLNTDRLVAWIKDVIAKNDIKLVLIWDEFSDYFKNNRNSLSEFQKIASLCQSTPFYFVIITHQTSSVIANKNDDAWKVIQQRYDGGFVEITLPDSIAFDLIGSALEVNPDTNVKNAWHKIADTLYSYVPESSKAVMNAAGITDENVIKRMMPLHPYAAMILKYIATAFEANQRSMFNFIKTASDEDVKAFQWFIQSTAYDDDRPLLTVDLLWDFFYVKGRNNLTADIQAILDTYPRQHDLGKKEKSVLKTILIMQAIGQRIGGRADAPGKVTELFSVTEKNLRYAFEGVDELEGGACVSVAKRLVNDGVLYRKPIGNNQEVYAVAALAGDQAKIDNNKKILRENLTTSKLVTEGGLSTLLSLTPALKLRFDIDYPDGKLTTVTLSDFDKAIDKYKSKDLGRYFHAVLAFAKDDTEVKPFRKAIKDAVISGEYDNIIFIDALSTPLGTDDYEQYLDFQSLAMYYSGPDNDLARKNAKDAKDVLDIKWRSRLEKGRFIVYTTANKDGDSYPNSASVIGALQGTVTSKFPLLFDFNKGLSESMLKLTQAKSSIKHGAAQTSGNAVKDIEKFTLDIAPNSVWKIERYWEIPALATLPISKIKIDVDNTINNAFENNSGQIAVRDVYDLLEDKYGFAPCNLTAFLVGFLLKEYCTDTYRFIDSAGKPFDMADRIEILGHMLSDYIANTDPQKYKDTYIARRTPAENAFYKLTEEAFDITPDSCATVGVAALAVGRKMKGLGLPIWALSYVDELGIYDIVEKYVALVQANEDGTDAQTLAIEIGRIAQAQTGLGTSLHALIANKENCRNGMWSYLKEYENGKIIDLAKEINADSNIIEDIRRLFNVERSYLWSKTTGESEISKLLIEYGIALETNNILFSAATSLKGALAVWREKIKYIHLSSEALAQMKNTGLAAILNYITKIYAQNDLLLDQLKAFLAELQTHGGSISSFFKDEKPLFLKIYEPYLEGLTDNVSDIIAMLPNGMFAMDASGCNIEIKNKAENFRKGQKKIELLTLWNDKTGSKTPKEWSTLHKCPILIMVIGAVIGEEYDKARKAFETINQTNPPEFAINDALAFLKKVTFFDDLRSQAKRDEAFVKHIIGDYAKMVTLGDVKARLDRLTVDAYDWYSHPAVKDAIKKAAESEYNAGGYDKVLSILNKMEPAERDDFIRQLVKGNVEVGIRIIAQGGE